MRAIQASAISQARTLSHTPARPNVGFLINPMHASGSSSSMLIARAQTGSTARLPHMTRITVRSQRALLENVVSATLDRALIRSVIYPTPHGRPAQQNGRPAQNLSHTFPSPVSCTHPSHGRLTG